MLVIACCSASALSVPRVVLKEDDDEQSVDEVDLSLQSMIIKTASIMVVWYSTYHHVNTACRVGCW